MSADGEAKTPESGMKKRNVAAGEAVSYMDHAKALQSELADDWATHFDDTKVRVSSKMRNVEIVNAPRVCPSNRAADRRPPVFLVLSSPIPHFSPPPFPGVTNLVRQKSIGASARNRKLVANLIEGYADKAPAKLAPLLRKLAPLAGWFFAINKIGFDISVVIYSVCNKYFSRLPYHLVMCVFGLILCFFGESSSSSSSGKRGITCAQYEGTWTGGGVPGSDGGADGAE